MKRYSQLIMKDWARQGLSVHEDGDHVLELRKDGKVIARFSQTGVTIENIHKAAREAIEREGGLN